MAVAMKPTGVIRGDCMDLMASLPTASVPLVVADPPYGIGYHSNHYKGVNPHAPVAHDWNFQIAGFLAECSRVLADGGALYLFCRWDVSPLWVPHIVANGLKLKTVIAWVKDNWSAGDLDGCFGNQYEQALFITKGRHRLRGKRWPNVWNFPRVPVTQMLVPTQKPVPLLERAIMASSDFGDLVVDPFAGSGSTGVACVSTGRNYLLCDIDPAMVTISRKRLGLPVLESERETNLATNAGYLVDLPSPQEWGIHPEDLVALVEELRANAGKLPLEVPA